MKEEEPEKEKPVFAKIKLPEKVKKQVAVLKPKPKPIEVKPQAQPKLSGEKKPVKPKEKIVASEQVKQKKPKPKKKPKTTVAKASTPKPKKLAQTPKPSNKNAPRKKTSSPIIAKTEAPKRKAPKRPNKNVAAASNLLKNMSSLLKGKKGGGLLSKAKKISGGRRTGVSNSVFSGESDLVQAGGPSVDLGTKSNVTVGFSDSGSANGKGSYRSTSEGDAPKAGQGGKFLDVGFDDSEGSLVADGLTPREVWEVIRRHFSEIRNCYESAIIRRPDVEGKLVVSFTINKSGKVRAASVKTSTLGDRGLDKCVITRLATWKFPRPKGRSAVSVLYPFLFRRL